jgi:pectate lyase
MFIKLHARAAYAVVALMLTACGGSGSGGDKNSNSSPKNSSMQMVSSEASIVSSSDASIVQSSTPSSLASISLSSQATSFSVTSSTLSFASSSRRSRGSQSSSAISTSSQAPQSSQPATSSRSSINSSRSSAGSSVAGELLAFPGAEGFAAKVTGGRGGRVIKVTNLNASGPGSLAEALAASGKRIVVFDVSGVIKIPGRNDTSKNGGILYIENGDVTIAGQTAPGAGITIQGRLYTPNVENIIIRHLRIRPEYDGSTVEQFDAVQTYYGNNIIMDHISASFGLDENIDIYTSNNITIQWSTIESASLEGEGNHNFGLISGEDGYNVSVLNNLFAHNARRNPAISNGPAEVINNVMYNVNHAFHHDDSPRGGNFNVAGNYYKRGPKSGEFHPFWVYAEAGEVDRSYFVNDWIDLGNGPSSCNEGAFTNPVTQCDINSEYPKAKVVNNKFSFSNIPGWKEPQITSPSESYSNVLAKAGAFPRDAITKRSVTETENRTGDWDSRYVANLMDGLTPGTAPVDTDNDGMPDEWETAQDLNPNDGTDHSKVMPSGYTAIEEYINELADELVK